MQDAIDEGKVVEETGKYSEKCKQQTFDAIEELSLMLVLVVHVEMKKSKS
jgi:hypothetical protein